MIRTSRNISLTRWRLVRVERGIAGQPDDSAHDVKRVPASIGAGIPGDAPEDVATAGATPHSLAPTGENCFGHGQPSEQVTPPGVMTKRQA